MDTAGTVLAVAGGCRAVEAARDALPHPVHVAFVTVAHGRLEAPMDRIGCFVTTGLWPERCVAGTARGDFAGVNPREAWVASRRTVAGSLRCPCGIGEPCGRPVVAAFGQARPRGRRGIGLGPVGVAPAGGSLRVVLRADVAAPEAAVAPGTLRVTWHLPRLHAPEPRTGAPVQASVRRASGVARTGWSNVAAPVGAGG